ncbi:Putative VHS domain, GAT domain, GAT domain superfamily protein [Septoria linicola]|uniref:VHS domain, GAT domain, GAT domain superfamily protein n=1 Tax=Septoria linicola TaxID=215465 RepID=A0A9Q9AI62_9PEZI|nr:putative VHS domain, GAT domain, GAT domain superfamily protein [Septoria linicola]USW49687.1 Putative VHS domain, GAT domain, GAT domain superfamily protein [Septoria linicola]
MNKFKGLLGRTKSLSARAGSRNSTTNFDDARSDSPEANVQRAIRLFCESGSVNNGGEEVLHLPVIVESAESSPTAAASAANQIKKFLGKDFSTKPYVQYNSIMLIRILSDNPGPRFTQNFDKSFVSTVKDMLRGCRDQSTQQILRETLDHLENDKAYDEGLQLLFQMWRKEKGQGASFSQAGHRGSYMAPNGFQQPYHGGYERSGASGRGSRGTGLPTAAELASRVEEARNTAKILLQLVQSTPSQELVNNELIKEFNERCQTASKSIQSYINATNPSPDDDTMQTLIETNEQLSLATSRYQRAILAARRAMGASPSPQQGAPQGTETTSYGAFSAPSGPPPAQQAASTNNAYTPAPNTFGGYQAPMGPPPTGNTIGGGAQAPQLPPVQQQNPFADPEPKQYGAFQAPQNQQGHHPQTVSFDDFDRQQQQPFQHSRTFTIEQEPSFAAPNRRNTNELENAYSSEQPKVSPVQTRDDHVVSPSSPQRPALGPYHQSDITQSYVGRQYSAANGLTMHGAQPYDQSGGHDVSPVETRR